MTKYTFCYDGLQRRQKGKGVVAVIYEIKRDLALFACRAAIDLDNVAQGKGSEIDTSRHLEPLLDWLCRVNRDLDKSIRDNNFACTFMIGKIYRIISQALGYDSYHPNQGDTFGSIFPKLRAILTANLCTLQTICHDPSDTFNPNDIRALILFCLEISEAAGAINLKFVV